MQVNTSHSLLDRLKSTSSSSDWDTFVEIYRPFILSQLNRFGIAGADAEDICQDSLTQVFKAIGGFDHNGRIGAFRNWLRTIVRQRISRYLSNPKSKNGPAASISPDEIAIENTLAVHWDKEHDQYVLNKLMQLISKDFTETSWRSFHRIVIGSEDPKVVAQSMSLTLNSVMISKSRIMRRLRELGRGMIDQL